ncbi:MAG: 16S rRNA (guanine(527)-N(7))-methyltransferase RsmG [Bacteroidales bacterium]|nr:16S rRNA (guanine(527)-N(7))-methyltransferase RsmG [Bacteroidales bacterium]
MHLIQKYFPDLSAEQQQQFALLPDLYADWNARINIISRKDIDKLEERHILHSLAIAKVIQFKPGTKILDVGTGGGFPGLPLAIMFPETKFLLIDSIGKKIKVVKEIVLATGLKNVKAIQIRAEDVKGKSDFIVSRAVARMPEFISWVKNKVSSHNNNTLDNGILYLKGGALEEELQSMRRPYAVYELQEYFSENFYETKKLVYIPLSD